MHHCLLVTSLIVTELRYLLQGLANSRDIAMTKDTKAASEKKLLYPIALHVLVFEKGDDSLCHCSTFYCLYTHMLPLMVQITALRELESTMDLNKAHYFIVSWHKIGAAMFCNQDGATSIAQSRGFIPIPSLNQAIEET